MRLTELLRLYQPEILEQLLLERGMSSPSGQSREDLVERFSEALLGPGAVEEILRSLSPIERSILYIVLFYAPTSAITEKEHRYIVPGVVREVATERGARPFRNLHAKGLLYRFRHAFRSASGAYVLPREILQEVSSVLVRQTIERYGVPVRLGEHGPPPGYEILVNDLLALLLLAAPEGIPLTRERVPYRKAMRRLEELLSPADMAEEVLCDPFWAADRYLSMRIEALFLFAEHANLLARSRSEYQVASGAFEKLRGSFRSRFSFWMDLWMLFSDTAPLFRQFIAEVVRQLPDDVGLNPGMFLAWSDPFPGKRVFSFGGSLAREAGVHLWKMVYAGVLQVMRGPQGQPLLVRTRLGTTVLAGDEVEPAQENRIFVVQPNFEVLCDPKSLAAAGEEVSPFVELVTVDRTVSLRFSRASVQRGLRRSHSITSCCQALHRVATQDLPKNVLDRLQEWASGYHRVYLRPGLLIQAETDEQAETLRHSSVFELIREEIGRRSFWASLDDLPEIRRRLRNLKIDVHEGPVSGSLEEEYVEELHTADRLMSQRREDTPEYHRMGFFEPAEQALRETLRSCEIVPPGSSGAEQRDNRLRPRWSTPQEIREVISEALLRDEHLCLTVLREKDRTPEVHTVYPICWSPERGRFSFYGVEPGGPERLWRLDEIISARVLRGVRSSDT